MAMDGCIGMGVPIGDGTLLRLVEMGAVCRQLQVDSRRIKHVLNAAQVDVLNATIQRSISEGRAVGRQAAPVVKVQYALSVPTFQTIIRQRYSSSILSHRMSLATHQPIAIQKNAHYVAYKSNRTNDDENK